MLKSDLKSIAVLKFHGLDNLAQLLCINVFGLK